MAITPQLWPIFICYRRADGIASARRLHEILDKWKTTGPDGNPIQLDVYLDENMPGVENWKDLHGPYLEKAQAMIVICTPGAKLDEGPDDYVHNEINWWLKHRKVAPILIDPLMEGERFVPSQIVRRFPDIQRIGLDEKEWKGLTDVGVKEKTAATQRQILGAILPSGAEIYVQELEQERSRTRRLRFALSVSIILLVATVVIGLFAFYQRQVAIKNQNEAQKQAELARRGTYNIQLSRIGDLWQRDPALALELLNDVTRAPLDLRDFTWGFLYRLSKKMRMTLPGHSKAVISVAFSPDGKTLASASSDKTIKLWGAQTGQQRATLKGRTGSVGSVAFSPDGRSWLGQAPMRPLSCGRRKAVRCIQG